MTQVARLLRRALLPLAASAALLVTCLFWAVSSPVGSSPDDDFHLASIWCARDLPGRACKDVPGPSDHVEPGVSFKRLPLRVGHPACYAGHGTEPATCIRDLPDRYLWARVNDGLYPRGYYDVMHVFVDQHHAVRTALVIRGVNALIAAAMIGVALIVSAGLLRRAVAVAWLVALVPLSLFLLASSNPSAWALVGIGTVWVFLLRFLRGPGGPGRWLALGGAVVATLMVIGSRTDANAYLCAVIVACVVLSAGSFRDLLSWRYAVPTLFVLFAAVRFLTLSSSGVLVSGASLPQDPEPWRAGPELLAYNLMNLPSLVAGAFGLGWGLGWIDTPTPAGVGVLTCLAPFALLVLALPTFYWRKVVAVGVVASCFVIPPLLVLQSGQHIVGEMVQPRYLLPLVPALIGLLCVSRDEGPVLPLSAGAIVLFVLASGCANAFALYTNLRRYVHGLADTQPNLDVHRGWWWDTSLTPMGVWALGAAAGFVLFALLGRIAFTAGRDAGRPATSLPG